MGCTHKATLPGVTKRKAYVDKVPPVPGTRAGAGDVKTGARVLGSGKCWFLHKRHYFQKDQLEAGEGWQSRKGPGFQSSETNGLTLVVPLLGYMTDHRQINSPPSFLPNKSGERDAG